MPVMGELAAAMALTMAVISYGSVGAGAGHLLIVASSEVERIKRLDGESDI